ncbi:MAG: molybdopterin cofactor-binding domain-containing protein [Kibdelosporangium sp.]
MIPANLQLTPQLSRWITVHSDGTVAVRSGKVELGQGILTALAQIVAEELDVRFERIRMIPMTTGPTPDEALTASSRSLEDSGAALRQAAAEVRACFLAVASSLLGTSDLTVEDGLINGVVSYWELASSVSLELDATGVPSPKPPSSYRIVGTSAERLDLPDKVNGTPRFIHDMSLPGMLHGRVVRPPSPGASLRSLDIGAAKALPGVVEIVRDGSFLGVVATEEETAIAAAELLRSHSVWDESASLPASLGSFLMSSEADTSAAGASPPSDLTRTAVYSRPYLAHASIAPSCAIAQWDGSALEVWSHTQGAYNLRKALSLAVPAESIIVHHVEGAGCYGHNAADDVTLDAVLLARAADRPVQVVWSRSDELTWAPFGPAAAVRLSAGLDPDGCVVAWKHETFGNGHVTRPGGFPVPSLLAAAHTADPVPLPVAIDPPLARGGGAQRNSVPLYTFPAHVVTNRLTTMPLRTSAMRSLGAFVNVFAIESFMDELASGVDPVEYRLRHLADPRAREVVSAAASASGWWTRSPTESRGYGFGFARYSDHGAYCAVVAEVAAQSAVRVAKLTIAVDAGLVVNPDGLRNQVEGGAIQSTSWTLKEQVTFDRTRVTSSDWESYPILRFSEVPSVEITLLDRPDLPSLGAGEAAQGPTAAAIANALFDATGIRVRNLPLTPENIIAAMPG